jgi:hypothetical protein
MGLIEQALPTLIRDVGAELDDLSVDYGTDARLTQNRVCRALDNAAEQLFEDLLADGVDLTVFKREFTLTADSSDSKRYALPPRTRQVGIMKDDNSEYSPLDFYQTQAVGFVVEENGLAVRWRNVSSFSGNVKGWLIQSPTKMQAAVMPTAATSTTIVLAASPSVGSTVIDNDYYNQARIAIVSGTGVGQVRTITDYVGSTRTCTVATWDTTPTTTGSSTYALLCDLPAAAMRCLTLRAAVKVARTDQKMRDYLPDIKADAERTYVNCLEVTSGANAGIVRRPRFVHKVSSDGTGEYI